MSVKSMAGALLGKGRDVLVRYDDATNEVVETLAIRGRWLYVRKCKRADMLGGIVLPDSTRDDTAFALVLAVGSACGKNEKRRLKGEPNVLAARRKMRDWVPGIDTDGIRPGETPCLFPDDHEWAIMRSNYDRDEYFIHETVAKCMIE